MKTIDPLFFEYKNNKDVQLRNKLVEKNIKLAYKIAHQVYAQTLFNLEELQQEALLTLIKAIENYDPEIGSFSTYAVIKIKGSLYNFLRDKSNIIRIPRPSYDLLRKWNKAKEQLLKELKRLPTTEEVAQFSGIASKDYLCAEKIVNECRAIACLTPTTIDSPPINQNFEGFMKKIFGDYSKLSLSQQKIITLFIFQNRSTKDISKLTQQPKKEIETILMEAIDLVQLTIN